MEWSESTNLLARTKNKIFFFLFGWIRRVWSKSSNAKKNLGQNVFMYAEKMWKELLSYWSACAGEFFYLLKCIERSRRGQEILLNGKTMCLWQCVCLHLFKKKKRREERKGEGPIHKRLWLQRLNFISSDRHNGRYVQTVCTQSVTKQLLIQNTARNLVTMR